MQTYTRAHIVFEAAMEKWTNFFREIAVDYFGDYFVEYPVFKAAMEVRMKKVDPKVRNRLLYIFNYEGQRIITEEDFLKVMRLWAAFTANDINDDNVLDTRELKMLVWLMQGSCPSQAKILKEAKIMDEDGSGTIDRAEWIAYLSAPREDLSQMGNAHYYDFETRELFAEIDIDGNLEIDEDELNIFLKKTYARNYNQLIGKAKKQVDALIIELADKIIAALKELAYSVPDPKWGHNPNPRTLQWSEFRHYRKVCKFEKEDFEIALQKVFNLQKSTQFSMLVEEARSETTSAAE